MKVKAVCVMRNDLRNSEGHKVPKGKLVAQGGHAFVGLLTSLFDVYERRESIVEHYDIPQLEYSVMVEKYSAIHIWLAEKFTKIVLAANSEEELLDIYAKAQLAGLNTVLITDAGDTEFSEPTNTCIGIGPDWEEKIDAITGHLKGFQ